MSQSRSLYLGMKTSDIGTPADHRFVQKLVRPVDYLVDHLDLLPRIVP